jgi:murein DD-endopeptidase MepM/ murein hydrolase activator NlpD
MLLRRLLLVWLALASPSAGASDTTGAAFVAALQVRLERAGLYEGPISGVSDSTLVAAVRAFQRRRGLVPDGAAGPVTSKALGARPLGSRGLVRGDRGWDVTELEFELAWHGFPSGDFDRLIGPRAVRAIRRFQRFAGLPVTGEAGRRVFAALRGAPALSPIPLSWPVNGLLSSPFGPRGYGFHTGIDLAAPPGTPVAAAASGTVTWAAKLHGGWGLLVVIAHVDHVRTLYAHLSEIDVAVGDRVSAGQMIGRVGATGEALGPHLHFEVRVRDAAVDPLPALPTASSARSAARSSPFADVLRMSVQRHAT